MMMSSRTRSLEEANTAAEKKKQKVTIPQRLHYGLVNQGATCYLNSVLQVLFMTTEIHERLTPKPRTTDQELRNIFEKLVETTCGTGNITESLGIENVYQQHDAAECLERILHKVSPRASEVFQGQLTYITNCSRGHSINEETNAFWTLPLSLGDTHDTTYSVEKGFERTFQTKSFGGDNRMYCNECERKTEATTGCEMVKCPQILTLLLKRFDFDYSTMSYVKSDRCVEVPRALQRKNKKYKLYGIVNHMGGLRGGHYTATILFNEDNTWYEFDDAQVKQVKEQPFAKTRTYNLFRQETEVISLSPNPPDSLDKNRLVWIHRSHTITQTNSPIEAAVDQQLPCSASSSTAYLLVYRASRSLRDKVERQPGETDHLDEQRAHKMEQGGHFGGREADDKDRHHQESPGQRREVRDIEALSVRGEYGEKDVLHKEKRKQRSKKEEDVNSLRPCSSLANIKKKPLLIGLAVFGCVFIVILLVIVLTLNT